MARTAGVSSFPWQSLEPVPRAPQATLCATRRWLERAFEAHRLAGGLGTLLGTPVELVVRGVDARPPPTPLVQVGLELASGEAGCVVGLEPALAAALLAALLRRPVPIVSSGVALDATLLGALSALLVEAARAAGGTIPLRATSVFDADAANDLAIVHATVILRDKPYVAAVWLPRVHAVTPAEPGLALLQALGKIELAVPLVVAASLTTPRTLSELTVGSAFCPGERLWIDASGQGRAMLVAGASERGFAVELGYSGEIVLREPAMVALAAAEATVMASDEASDPTLADAVLDAPLVVRVELGSVSMPAREWAVLKPGDVIGTGRRIAEPVLLRAGGEVLARGELVNLEGELAVRVLELPAKGRP